MPCRPSSRGYFASTRTLDELDSSAISTLSSVFFASSGVAPRALMTAFTSRVLPSTASTLIAPLTLMMSTAAPLASSVYERVHVCWACSRPPPCIVLTITSQADKPAAAARIAAARATNRVR